MESNDNLVSRRIVREQESALQLACFSGWSEKSDNYYLESPSDAFFNTYLFFVAGISNRISKSYKVELKAFDYKTEQFLYLINRWGRKKYYEYGDSHYSIEFSMPAGVYHEPSILSDKRAELASCVRLAEKYGFDMNVNKKPKLTCLGKDYHKGYTFYAEEIRTVADGSISVTPNTLDMYFSDKKDGIDRIEMSKMFDTILEDCVNFLHVVSLQNKEYVNVAIGTSGIYFNQSVYGGPYKDVAFRSYGMDLLPMELIPSFAVALASRIILTTQIEGRYEWNIAGYHRIQRCEISNFLGAMEHTNNWGTMYFQLKKMTRVEKIYNKW